MLHMRIWMEQLQINPREVSRVKQYFASRCENNATDVRANLYLIKDKAGNYQVEATLDHTLCDGFTDPPQNWFVVGNAQGKNQDEGVLGPPEPMVDRPYILKPLRYGNPIWISIRPVPPGKEPMYKVVQSVGLGLDLTCGIQCNFLWDGFGNWVSGNQGRLRWKPFITADDVDRHSSLNPSPLRPDSVLWIYGDSVSEQFFWGIRPRPLCTNVFKWCGHTYNWIYQLKGKCCIHLQKMTVNYKA
ncbi:PREDICTED: uncharacterized protein LOC107354880 [Acropora digitifera]|uniref:uncharacterized protein LOC107354880 n=1 Tax=Acropora digitifera TaxID=70779 RepID=UPI00077AC68D|nr:PREDICTED: uncharacterized protein LOC107354880 [Acropora digitifera]